MAGPEANLWQSMRKALKPEGMRATRLENRHGGGVPDVELQWATGSAFVELKAPASQPRPFSKNQKLLSEILNGRPYLFCFSESFPPSEMLKLKTLQDRLDFLDSCDVSSENQSLCVNATSASSSQRAWHAGRYASGGLSFFLKSTVGQGSKSLYSPVLLPGSGNLVLGHVWTSGSWSEVLGALRGCAEMHSLAALR